MLAEAGHFNKLFNKLPTEAEGVCAEQGRRGHGEAAITARGQKLSASACQVLSHIWTSVPTHCGERAAEPGKGLGTGYLGEAGWRGLPGPGKAIVKEWPFLAWGN